MFTIKYIDERGDENISEHAYVTADRKDGFQRVLVFDDVPSASGDNNNGCFAERPCGETGSLTPRLYVMNRFGATVANYSL